MQFFLFLLQAPNALLPKSQIWEMTVNSEATPAAQMPEPRKSLADGLDIDELGSIQHCLAAISSASVPLSTQGNVESEK
jgi:hypothetical protein